MQPKLFGYVHVHMYSWQVDLNVPRHIRCKFIGYTVHNFRDCNLNILACDPIKYKWTAFTLERDASNEYPLQTFSLRNKKIVLWVSIALDLVLNIFVLHIHISK